MRSRVTARSIRTAAKEQVGKTIEKRGGTPPQSPAEELLELAESSEASLSEEDTVAASQAAFELDPDPPSPGDDGGAQPLPGNIPNGGHGNSGHQGGGPDMGPPADLDPNQGAIPGSPTAAPS